jgi:uncharacterized double-CXXCG motif protein
MESAFVVRPDTEGWEREHRFDIDAAHFFNTPGVHCSICGNTWAMTGIQYPSVCPKVLIPFREEYPSPKPVSVLEFGELARKLLPLVGPDRPLRPGTKLGPSVGRFVGEQSDFTWVNQWTPLIRRSVLEELRRREVSVEGADAKFKQRGGKSEATFEIEARPSATFHRTCLPTPLPEPCSGCGRNLVTLPDGIVVERESLDQRQLLQRIWQFPTCLIVSGRNADLLTQLRLSNLLLSPIEVRSRSTD